MFQFRKGPSPLALYFLIALACGCQDGTRARVLSQDDFQREVLDADGPVVLAVTQAAEESDKVALAARLLHRNSDGTERLVVVDFGGSQWMRDEWNVRQTPMLLAFERGAMLDRYAGAFRETELAAWFDGLQQKRFQAAVDAVTVPELPLTSETFDTALAAAETPVLVDFWAAWCGPCRMVAPHLRLLSGELEGRLTVAKVNVDEERETARRFVRGGLPLLVLFQDGQEVDRIEGAPPPAVLRQWVISHLDQLAAADASAKD